MVADLDDSPRFTPPGFQNGMDRGHLIARRFGGSNTKPENFVPLYPDANQNKMARIEDIIAKRLNNGERLYVYVRPVYRPGATANPYIPVEVEIYVSGPGGHTLYVVNNK